MTDQPATTPADDEPEVWVDVPAAADAYRVILEDDGTIRTEPADQTPAADRETALTLRIGDLREQRDQARRDRDAARALAVKAQTDADDLQATHREELLDVAAKYAALRTDVLAIADRIHDLPFEWTGSVHPYDVADWLRAALDGET